MARAPEGTLMVAPAAQGIDLFKIAGRSISGWIPSLKTGAAIPRRQPFCSQLEERLLMWLEYHPQVVLLSSQDAIEIGIYLLGLQPHIRDVLARKDNVVPQDVPSVEYPTQDMAEQDL